MKSPLFWHDPDSRIAKALSPLGALYGSASSFWTSRQTFEKLSIPVICVGNLVLGGAGKTPVAMMLAQELLAQEKRVHFVSRGYGGRLRGPVRVQNHSFQEVGDEPLMLAEIAPTWVAKNRRAGGIAAVQAGADVIILDDGHQNFSLHKDVSLIVIDTDYQLGNGRVFPAGPLREPVAQSLARAQGLVLIGEQKLSFASSLPFLRLKFEPSRKDLEVFHSKKLLPFAGIGRPQKFFNMLEEYAASYGFKVMEGIPFSDHHVYTPRDLKELRDKAKKQDAFLVTTEKDFLKILHPQEIYRIKLAPRIIEGAWDDVWKGLF